MNENITPLPCPFCGGELDADGFHPDNECFLSWLEMSMLEDDWKARWNIRADNALTARVKELEEALRDNSHHIDRLLKLVTSSDIAPDLHSSRIDWDWFKRLQTTANELRDKTGMLVDLDVFGKAALNKEPTT